jgi:hypothetical protein
MKFDRGAMLFPSPCPAAVAIGLRRGRLICRYIMSFTVLIYAVLPLIPIPHGAQLR